MQTDIQQTSWEMRREFKDFDFFKYSMDDCLFSLIALFFFCYIHHSLGQDRS